MQPRSLRSVTALLAVAALSFITACSSPDDSSPSSDFSQVVTDTITEAHEAGASDRQIAILQGSLDTQKVSTESIRESARAAVECLADEGIEARLTETTSSAGVLMLGFEANIGNDDPAIEAKVDDCDFRELRWVSTIYTSQPSALEATDKYIESQLPALSQCIKDNGGTVPGSASRSEIMNEAQSLLTRSDGDIDCFGETGMDNF
jgi:hypothetical protein